MVRTSKCLRQLMNIANQQHKYVLLWPVIALVCSTYYLTRPIIMYQSQYTMDGSGMIIFLFCWFGIIWNQSLHFAMYFWIKKWTLCITFTNMAISIIRTYHTQLLKVWDIIIQSITHNYWKQHLMHFNTQCKISIKTYLLLWFEISFWCIFWWRLWGSYVLLKT